MVAEELGWPSRWWITLVPQSLFLYFARSYGNRVCAPCQTPFPLVPCLQPPRPSVTSHTRTFPFPSFRSLSIERLFGRHDLRP